MNTDTHSDRGARTEQRSFGPLITTRGRSLFEKIILTFLMGVLGLLMMALAALMFMEKLQGRPSNVGVGFMGLGITALCAFGIYSIFRSASFYQSGAIETHFGKRREFAYTDATSLDYSIVRRYVNGIYAGTHLTFRMDTVDGRKLKMSVRHKEKPKGLAITVFGKKFTGEDEMDVVRDIIASHVANRLTTQLAETGSVMWGKTIRLTSDGIEPLRGKRKGQTVLWKDVAGARAERGWLHIFAHGDTKSFISTLCGGTNFYPCTQLLSALMEPVRPAATRNEPIELA